ncbi:hypothetical protein SAMN05421856_101472 [Chryseobacterium taichungense]|uniref:Uncharacterized protein n=1 Tax=Chryseobacterium taichungense TaxID=295069 RepID=A0A1H7W4Z7_9FLAO|nr:hypothetical protein [Chryseobacterium taichungense]SEM16135.1 hypothetical protein SAMN05421856_101472 [Chryseobacterium taichungense]
MKINLLLLFLLGSVGMVCGQVKLLSECTSKEFLYLGKSGTSDNFFRKLKENDDKKELEDLIKKNTGLNLLEINENIISPEKEELKSENIYKICGKESDSVFVNLKETKVFVINGKDNRKLFFYIENGLFLVDTNKKVSKSLIKDRLNKAYENIGYNCDGKNIKAMHTSAFDEKFNIIKKAIILSSSDNVTNNNAIAFTNGSNDTKISIGANFNYRQDWFFNLGIYTENIKTGFLYSNKSWKDNIGALLTFNKVFPGVQYPKSHTACDELERKRIRYKNSIIEEGSYSFETLRRSKKAYDEMLDSLKILQENIQKGSGDFTAANVKRLEEYEIEVSKLKEKITLYEKIVSNPDGYIDSLMISFDKKNDILEGNKLHWLKTTVDISNQNVELDTVSVAKFILKDGEVKNFPKLSVELSYNFNRHKKTLLNVQGFFKVTMGSLLEANIGSERPVLQQKDDDVFIFDSMGRQLGKYSYLKRAFWTLQSGTQGSFFITDSFGFTGYASHTFALQNMEYTDYRNRYSLMAGLVFKINNTEDINKATFRILGGVENEPYKTKVLDNFMVKISLGIPFGIFTKK